MTSCGDHRERRASLTALVVVVSLLVSTAHASDPNKPHPHRGILKPVLAAPAAVGLSASDKAELEAGEVIQRHVDMQNSVWGFSFGFYTKNTVREDLGYMSWVLDYDRESDVSDMVGYWRVEEVSSSPAVTKLEYSTQIHMKGVPGFVVRYLTKDALSEGTEWVKEHAEAAR